MKNFFKFLLDPINYLFNDLNKILSTKIHDNIRNFKPSYFTLLSFLMSIFCFYFIINHNFKIGALFFMVSHFFDTLDTYYGKKYKNITRFGYHFDFILDVLKYFIISNIILFTKEISYNLRTSFAIYKLLFGIFLLYNMGCEEKIKQHSYTLPLRIYLGKICYDDNLYKYTRFLNQGIFDLTIFLFLYNLNYIIYNF